MAVVSVIQAVGLGIEAMTAASKAFGGDAKEAARNGLRRAIRIQRRVRAAENLMRQRGPGQVDDATIQAFIAEMLMDAQEQVAECARVLEIKSDEELRQLLVGPAVAPELLAPGQPAAESASNAQPNLKA